MKKPMHIMIDARHRRVLETISKNEGVSLAEAARRCFEVVANQAQLAASAIPIAPPGAKKSSPKAEAGARA